MAVRGSFLSKNHRTTFEGIVRKPTTNELSLEAAEAQVLAKGRNCTPSGLFIELTEGARGTTKQVDQNLSYLKNHLTGQLGQPPPIRCLSPTRVTDGGGITPQAGRLERAGPRSSRPRRCAHGGRTPKARCLEPLSIGEHSSLGATRQRP